MRGSPATADEIAHARAIRRAAVELGRVLGLPNGAPAIAEVSFGPEGYLNTRLHGGPFKTDDDLVVLARSVGVLIED
jgi:hypothetical protein